PVISIPAPCNNQTIDELPQALPIFHPTFHSEAESPFTLDSTPTYVDESSNVFNPPPQSPVYPCEFSGNDAYYGHYCTPQALFIYPEPCYNQDFNFPQDFQDVPQQYPCCDDCGVTHDAYQCQSMNEVYYYGQNSCYDSTSIGFEQSQPQQYTVDHPIFNAHNSYLDSQIRLNSTLANINDQMTSITDEHLDTILATKSDEFIKSSVENLILIPSKSEGIPEHVCDVPSHDNSLPLNVSKDQFEDFSESNEEFSSIDDDSFSIDDIDYVLFDAKYESDSSDDQSCSDEDVIEKIVSKPLSEEEIIPMESLRTHDSSFPISSKIDSLLEEFAGELTLLKSIPPGIDETDCDFEEDIRLIEKLLYDNSSPRPPEEFVSANSDAKIKSFSPSPILVKDSDSLMEEIDLFCTSDYPMPPGILDKDYDSEMDILIPKDLPSNNSLLFAEKKSFHFDIPLFSRPPAKPPDGDT
nr:hypothetical protein [Tanacetum cinerariifolium]